MPKNPSKKKAVTYCRVSSNKQVREGHGLSSQDTRCREFAKHKGYDVIATFHDEGVSGSLIERPKMQEMLDFIAASNDQIIVLIDDISRLARGLDAHIQLRTAISEVGGKLESPSIEFGEDSDSILVENLLASVSQHQRQKNAEQVKNRMRARVMNGYWISNPMVGYKYKDVAGHGKLLTRHEPIATILQNALEKFAAGQLETQSEVRDYLLQHEVFPRKKDGTIHLQQIKEMLTRVLYAGYISLPKWGIYMQPGKHEPIISYETFERIQKRLESKSKAPSRKDLDKHFPLRGFIECSSCGGPMTSCWSRSANKKRYAYYLCQNKGCAVKGKSVRKDVLEEEFDHLLRSVCPPIEVVWMARDMFKDIWATKRQQNAENKYILKSKHKQVEQKIGKLVERIVQADSLSLMNAYESSIQKLEEEKASLTEKIKKCGTTLPEFEDTFRTAIDFFSNPYELWGSGDIEHQRTVLKLLFTERIPYTLNEGFRTPETSEPLRVCNQIHTGKYDMVRLP